MEGLKGTLGEDQRRSILGDRAASEQAYASGERLGQDRAVGGGGDRHAFGHLRQRVARLASGPYRRRRRGHFGGVEGASRRTIPAYVRARRRTSACRPAFAAIPSGHRGSAPAGARRVCVGRGHSGFGRPRAAGVHVSLRAVEPADQGARAFPGRCRLRDQAFRSRRARRSHRPHRRVLHARSQPSCRCAHRSTDRACQLSQPFSRARPRRSNDRVATVSRSLCSRSTSII